MTPAQQKILEHTVGGGEAKRKWGYRNRYFAPLGNETVMSNIQSLIDYGFMVQVGEHDRDQGQYRATLTGCRYLRMTKKQIDYCFED